MWIQWSHNYVQPEGFYLSYTDRGRIRAVLENVSDSSPKSRMQEPLPSSDSTSLHLMQFYRSSPLPLFHCNSLHWNSPLITTFLHDRLKLYVYSGQKRMLKSRWSLTGRGFWGLEILVSMAWGKCTPAILDYATAFQSVG